MSHFCPTHTGDYVINIMWSGTHVPGNPFLLTITDREEKSTSVAVGGAMNECCSGFGDKNLQEGVIFFQI